MIHPAKGFGVVNKAEVDVFLELSCFSYNPAGVGNLLEFIGNLLESLVPLPFLNLA